MRIVHICLSAPYVDGWGYQENLLPEYLHKAGTENHIITSNNNLSQYISQEIKNKIISKGNKYTLDNVIIHKINSKGITSSLLIPFGLEKKLEEINPDVIFHHNISFTTIPIVSKFAKKHNCILFADNHADEINMSKNKFWILLNYKILSRIACRIRRNVFTKFYGVTNSRCYFLNRYYGIPKEMIELLPIGADTELADKLATKKELRKKYGIPEDEFIIVSGGKMGEHKGTINLIKAIEEINQDSIRLVLFGKFEDKKTIGLVNEKKFIYLYDWCDRIKTLEILKLADIACWPIHHTTLIEDCIAVETPLIIRKTGTTEHLIDGNGVWLKTGDKEELAQMLNETFITFNNEKGKLTEFCKDQKDKLSYRSIAKRIVESAKQN